MTMTAAKEETAAGTAPAMEAWRLDAPQAGLGCAQEECHLFGALLNEVPHGVLVLDDDGVILFANLAVNVMFLPHQLEVGGTIGTAAVLEPLVHIVAEARSRRARAEQEVRLTLPYIGEWNQEHHYHLSAAPWSEGGRSGVWVMAEDQTERHHSQQTQRDFLTNAGHELRTPLSLIHGYIETLKSGMIKNTTSLVRCLEVMEKHSRRMMRIIDDMLTISRLETQDEPLKTETFLVRACVQDVLEHLTPLIEMRQATVSVDLPPDGGVLHGDRFYWDKIFTNLIEHPLKENLRSGLRVKVCGRWTPHECVLTVEDNGVGIRPEEVPFVFRRFHQTAKKPGQEGKGTGLGLSIVKRAVEAHGGGIEVESVPGVRTVFTIRLPLPD